MRDATRTLFALTLVLATVVSASAQRTASDDADLSLRRGLYESRTGDAFDALTHLRDADTSAASQRERARWLLDELLRTHEGPPVAGASRDGFGPWRGWAGILRAVADGTAPGDTPDAGLARLLAAQAALAAGDATEALRTLDDLPRAHRAWGLALRASALETLGRDPIPTLRDLAGQEDAHGLADHARLRLATLTDDPATWLEGIPEDSPLAPRAWHLRAKLDLEAGDLEAARAHLHRALEAGAPDPVDLHLTLAAIALEQERPADALTHAAEARAAFASQTRTLEAWRHDGDDRAVWSAWEQRSPWYALALDTLDQASRAAFDHAADLRREAPDTPADDALASPRPDLGDPASALASPDPAALAAVDAAATAAREARFQLFLRRGQATTETRRIARRERQLTHGIETLERNGRAMAPASARLDSMVAEVDAVLAQLAQVREAELLRIATRTRALLERARTNLQAARDLDHLYVQGPLGRRDRGFPEGVPTPARLLAEDRTLEEAFEHFLVSFAARAPDLIARSSASVWEPRIQGDVPRLADRARQQLAWNTSMADTLRFARAALATDPLWLAARDDADAAQVLADSLALAHATLRRDVALAALDSTLAHRVAEREGIDYLDTAARYELAVADPEAVESSDRTAAIDALRDFLATHPESPARGEARFRLADVLLIDERTRFHARMERYLAERERGGNPVVPFVDTGEAIALYEAILAEDPGFPHRDAVLFHAGMILADEVDPRGERYLQQLLDEDGRPEFAQRAQVRIADLRFEAGAFASALDLYEAASAGPDASLSAIALYKLGWSHLNREDQEGAIDAFHRLLDLYVENEAIDTEVDLRGEAEDDLIHALARGGGAARFTALFDRIGPRPYETRILIGMAQLMRSYALHEEAAETDRLFLSRYPTHPEALRTAERLVDTTRRWAGETEVFAAQRELATRFLPGTEWSTANPDQGVEAAEFARTSLRAVALHHHRRARADQHDTDWRQAASLYAQMLDLWPDDGEAPRFHLLSGEAHAALDAFDKAIPHFTAAAASDTASFAPDAHWQVVAVTDRWYESTRVGDGAGADSLATRWIDAARGYREAYPADPRNPDLRWREGNLAFAHDWFDRAETALLELQTHHPEDPRLPQAARLRADAHYRRDAFDRAADAYTDALRFTSPADSSRAELRRLIPHCGYRHAESLAATDSTGREAPLAFRTVAQQWPDFEHADQAWYVSGLGFLRAQDTPEAVRSFEGLLARHPDSRYARDAHLQIAGAWVTDGQPLAAARAYEQYARAYPTEDDADDAWLKASDLRRAGGDEAGAEQLLTGYLERWPEDVEMAAEIRGRRARRELDALGTAPVGSLLGAASGSELSAFLALAAQHPEQVDRDLVARVRFLEAEARRDDYLAIRLTQPLDRSLERKNAAMAELLDAYGQAVDLALAPWAQAAAFRIGEAMVHFGDALVESEPPADLSGDDLIAYHEVLEERAWEFHDRGEAAWKELLRQGEPSDEATREWLARTRDAFTPRVAARFLHQPELEFPVVDAARPAR